LRVDHSGGAGVTGEIVDVHGHCSVVSKHRLPTLAKASRK
jgi:hypothetical protein